MHQLRPRTFLALALLLLAAPAALAQSEAPRQEDNYVTQKMFQNRVFDVKNRDPQSLVRVLAPLTSGFRGAVVSANPEFRTISVRDFAENIAVIEEAIRRLDMPEAARPAFEFSVHLLVASNDEAVANRYPAELADVVKQLQGSLGYKNFSLMGSQIVRAREGREHQLEQGRRRPAAGERYARQQEPRLLQLQPQRRLARRRGRADAPAGRAVQHGVADAALARRRQDRLRDGRLQQPRLAARGRTRRRRHHQHRRQERRRHPLRQDAIDGRQ